MRKEVVGKMKQEEQGKEDGGSRKNETERSKIRRKEVVGKMKQEGAIKGGRR